MVMWGQNEQRLRSLENDGYFDTATFGDTGGQLWVLRFSQPGKLDATTRKVTNWYGARIMSMPGCGAQPFFYITGNVALRQGYYRVVAGTGDRYNLLDTNGGQCDPDNPRACAQRGCTVTHVLRLEPDLRGRRRGRLPVHEHDGGTCAAVATSALTTPATCTAGGSATHGDHLPQRRRLEHPVGHPRLHARRGRLRLRADDLHVGRRVAHHRHHAG